MDQEEHIQRFVKALLNAVDELLDKLVGRRFNVVEYGLRENMAQQPPFLAARRTIHKEKTPNGFRDVISYIGAFMNAGCWL